MNVGRCVGRLTLDWLHLCIFFSNYLENWSAGNSLVMKNHFVLLVDGGSAAIAARRMMFNRGTFLGGVGEGSSLIRCISHVLKLFPQELECWQ